MWYQTDEMRSRTNEFANGFTTLRLYDFFFFIDEYGLCQRNIDFGKARKGQSGTELKGNKETMSIPRWQEHMILISEGQRRRTRMLVMEIKCR